MLGNDVINLVRHVLNTIKEGFLVDYEIDRASAIWSKLSKDNVLSDAGQCVMLTKEGSFK